MWKMFFLAAFFGKYHTFLIGFRSGPCGGQTEQWNVIPLLSVSVDQLCESMHSDSGLKSAIVLHQNTRQ